MVMSDKALPLDYLISFTTKLRPYELGICLGHTLENFTY